jgi:hypothetical protein
VDRAMILVTGPADGKVVPLQSDWQPYRVAVVKPFEWKELIEGKLSDTIQSATIDYYPLQVAVGKTNQWMIGTPGQRSPTLIQVMTTLLAATEDERWAVRVRD